MEIGVGTTGEGVKNIAYSEIKKGSSFCRYRRGGNRKAVLVLTTVSMKVIYHESYVSK